MSSFFSSLSLTLDILLYLADRTFFWSEHKKLLFLSESFSMRHGIVDEDVEYPSQGH